jgi:ferric-dicitrate binding protein FerR (iron transport regulator)
VVVVEGRVRLEAVSGVVEAGPGQIAFLDPGSPPRVVDHGDVWSVLEWADGLLIYEDTPLSMVAEELSRHFGRKVTLAHEALGQLRITAWFEEEPLEEVVSAVCLVAGVECEVGPPGATLGR